MTPYTMLLAGYLGLLAAALAVECFGRAGHEPLRPLGQLLQQARASPVGRATVWAGWIWIGFHFLAR
jgi:Family of unknown function (DUF6186)